MKKTRMKIALLLALFASASLCWFWISMRKNRDAALITYAAMEEPSFPVIWAESCGRRMNPMRGYVSATDADIALDTLTLLPEDRELALCIRSDETELLELRYEIRSADLSNLIERTEVPLPDEREGELRLTLPIQNLLRRGSEYRMELILRTAEKGELHYYTRLGFDESGLAPEMLQLAEDFSARNFDYDAARENTMYLESSESGDNSSFALVTLKSDYNQLTYGKLRLAPTGEADLRLLEYSGSVGVIRRSLTASGDGADGAQMQFEISEFFVMRKGPERIYIMDYVRSMHEIFLGDRNAFEEQRVRLGISEDGEVQSASSPDGRLRAFVSAGDLWLLNGRKNRSVRVWSFRSGTDSGLRGGYFKHSAKILGLTDDGKLDFLVCGYMNRGRHEGKVGLALLQYDCEENTVREQAFIPSSRTCEEVLADAARLSYRNAGGLFYFLAGGAVYALDMQSAECFTVCGRLAQGGLAVGGDQSEIAWQEEGEGFGAGKIYLMNLESGVRREMKAEEGQLLRTVGFIGRDLAVGVAERGNVWKLNGIERELPFTAIEIVDGELRSQKHYEESGVLVADACADGTRIHLTRLRKNGENSFVGDGEDTIVCNAGLGAVPDILTETTELRKKTCYAPLPEGFSSGRMKTAIPKAIHFEASTEVELPPEAASGPRYSAYGKGRYLGSYESLGEAMNVAYEGMGLVRSGGVMRYCRAGTASVRTLRNAEGRAEELLAARLEDRSGDLYGASFRTILYFISRGKPVLGWSDGGTPLLIYAYDQLSVSMYSPSDGQHLKLSQEEAELMFRNGRNDFYCRLKD